MKTSKKNPLDWLRDAHAMEEQAERMLTATAGRIEHYPLLRERLLAHAEETRHQRDDVRRCIERLGGDTSLVKDVTGKVVAAAQGLSGMFVTDEVVKAVLSAYAFEHMEIASYRILIAAAQLCGDTETVQTCQAILLEEEAMAGWLAEQMPSITTQYLQRSDQPGVTAKH